jgi:hypothetical protein
LAAAVAVAIGMSLYFANVGPAPMRGNAGRDRARTAQAPEPAGNGSSALIGRKPPLGISLQGESAQSYLAVAGNTADSDVQMYWLYESLGKGEDGM